MRPWLAVGLLLASGCITPPADEPTWAWTNPFLASDPFRIVIDHVPGRAPSVMALEGLHATLQELGTSANLTVRESLPELGRPYTTEDILALHAGHDPGSDLTWRDAEGTGVLHVLYLDGNSTDDEGARIVYGLAFGMGGIPLIAIFPDLLPTTSLFRASTQLPGQGHGGYERSVLVHEFGHMLGLVACGLPEVHPHADPEDECHSRNESSVMAASMHAASDPLEWAFDDEMQPVWRFDADDWADIRAGQRALAGA